MGGTSSKSSLSLSDEDLTFLVRRTSMSREEIQVRHRLAVNEMISTPCQAWHQGFTKDCPGGELSKPQFVSMYSKMFPGGNPTAFSENVFRTFDTNNSGTIDFRTGTNNLQTNKHTRILGDSQANIL